MSTPEVSIPVDVEKDIIGANLNSSMLLNFLMGVYTMVYAGTMYLYLSKKAGSSISRTVLSAISVLYLLCVSEFVIQWFFLDLTIVDNGDTRESIFFQTLGGSPDWIILLSDFQFYSALMVSDGLLIWRCFHVWGRSFKVVSVPLLLFIGEFGLFCAEMILAGLSTRITGGPNTNLFNNIESALTFASAGTTVVTTLLIGYRIHLTSRIQVSSSTASSKFKHVLRLVIESAAVYSLVVILDAISIVVPPFTNRESPFAEVEYYVESVLIIIAGLAPTVLVARSTRSNTSSTTHKSKSTCVSGLRFGSQHGNENRSVNTVVDSSVLIDSDRDDAALTPEAEEKKSPTLDPTFSSYQF
ncbi:hypothetical protein CVT25_003467 [Psilocybe cyanescens]|uniref:Uncharacterized protein n=1 Tax=Psilocybe cyanescens TaxID=93625 RepID=A0A409WM44_PSICY|nr:hypothetical protein CVT25_003467 [Psilocybe cyanescens]